MPDFTRIEMGQSPPSTTYNMNGNGLPFFQGKAEFGSLYPEVRKHCSEPNRIAEPGATLLSVRAPVGPTNLARERCCIGRGLAAIHPLDQIPEKFVLWLLRSREPEISEQGTGSTFSAINRKFLHNLSIPLPPLAEQKRIVSRIEELFSELDAGEAALKKARHQLGVYRQALLKQAFEGKLTAPWRAQNPDLLESPDQLLTRIQSERQAEFEKQLKKWGASVEEWESNGEIGKKPSKPRATNESDPIGQKELQPLAELPNGWTYARLSESIVNIDAGKSFSCDERPPAANEIGVAKVSAVTWGEYDEAESKTCRDAAKIVPEYFINPGDFLLSRANTIELVGAVVIVKRTTKNVMLSDKTLRINFAGIEPHFILQYLRCRTGRLEIMSRSSGNQESMRNIGQDRVGAIITPLCPLPEQQEIVRLLDEQFEVIDQNEREIDAALKRSEALRQSILRKA
ncbi:MAG: restriction endonuclease subunit S, partial [Verrucomicrobiales bacterium]|nr:restriction endonuclease subunit S [Verrucomicrobiales bacterium]